MCVPCVAAAPEFWPFLIGILIVLGAIITALAHGLKWVAVGLAFVGWVVYRWLSGAVMFKEPGQKDVDYWEREVRQGRPGPKVTRSVRATGRLALTAVGAGLLVNWVITALVAGAVSVAVSGGAVYGRRVQIISGARQINARARSAISR